MAVPIILTSDETHLTNFSGDKKMWPIYMTIGNIPARVRGVPSRHALVLLALLPIPPKMGTVSAAVDEERRQQKAIVHHEALHTILKPLVQAGTEGIRSRCPDMRTRKCFPVVLAWIADHREYLKIFLLSIRSCPVCEVPSHELDSPVQKYETRDYAYYRRCLRTMRDRHEPIDVRAKARAYLDSVGVRAAPNALTMLPHIRLSTIHTPDILHGMYLGVFKHFMDWNMAFLKKWKRLDVFDKVWVLVPGHPGLYVTRRVWREIVQWQGKEMKSFSRIILAVLASTLSTATDAERPTFERVLACILALTDFNMVAQFEFHSQTTLKRLEKLLESFQESKAVFGEYRRPKGKRKRGRVNVGGSQNPKRTSGVPSSTPAPGSAAADVLENNDDAEDDNEDEMHFNFVKMHLLIHYIIHIIRLGAIPFSSTNMGELAHKQQIKNGYRSSNRQHHFEQQILVHHSRRTAMDMRLQTVKLQKKEGYNVGPVDFGEGTSCVVLPRPLKC